MPQPPSSTPFVPPTRDDWDTVLQLLFDEYFRPSPCVDHLHPKVVAPVHLPQHQLIKMNPHQILHKLHKHHHPILFLPVLKKQIMILKLHTCTLIPNLVFQFQNIVLKNSLLSYFDAFLSFIEPKSYKEALTESCWIEAMEEELNEFERIQVWELVPHPDRVMIITLKWIYKVKLDELGGVFKNKDRLVANGYHQEEGIDFEESFVPVA
nr:retrovirus-related Pol polyprotein from transposon TNT 1-94 [Tanacetum cinerariifolium]